MKQLLSILLDNDQKTELEKHLPSGSHYILSSPMSDEQLLEVKTWDCLAIEMKFGFHRAIVRETAALK